MTDILDQLAVSTLERIGSGYYDLDHKGQRSKHRSFAQGIDEEMFSPIIAEIKAGSPTKGKLLGSGFNPKERATCYLKSGALGLSVLTEPDHFYGSLEDLEEVSDLNNPVLMKDFVLDYPQIEAAHLLGADALLLIYRLFNRGYSALDLDEAINYIHKLGLEVLLETNDKAEYKSALNTNADMIGINNRDLRTLDVELSTTKNILSEVGKDRIVWSMSGISEREDVRFLEDAGTDAFLVGTSLTQSSQPEKLLRKLRGG